MHGHQDKNPWNTLDLLTSLNVICDAEAVSYQCALKHQCYYPQQRAIYGEKWIPVINGERAVRNLRECLCLSLTWPRLHAHWNIKRTPHTDLNAIVYDAIDHAFQNVPSGRHRWFVKHVARLLFGPVGLMMHRRKEWSSPACPWCGEVETTEHVWTCQSATVTELWDK